MITLKKILSALLVTTLMVAVTGVSFSRHICLSGKSAVCVENEGCCKSEHSPAKKSRCCTVEKYYFKADIVSTHDIVKHKFFTDNFIAFFHNHFFVAPAQHQFAANDLIPRPPLLRSCRSILLDSSRLTV